MRRSSLRSWDDVRQPVPVVTASDRRRDGTRAGWWVAVAIMAAIGTALGGFAIGRNRPPTVQTEIVTVTVTATAAPTSTVLQIPAAATTVLTAAPPVTLPSTTVAPAAATTTVPIPAGPIVAPNGVLSAGKLVLRGSMPSQAAIDGALAKARALLGADSVTNEYQLDGRLAEVHSASIAVADVVRFEAGSATPTPESIALVQAVGDLLLRSPDAFVIANSYTDDEGDALRNVGLAKERTDALVTLWTAQGVNPSRVIPASRGTDDPIADNATTEGRAQNRRISLVIHDLL
jgi:outer membrane protein OmpA-like peptidoglycan-associated protein